MPCVLLFPVVCFVFIKLKNNNSRLRTADVVVFPEYALCGLHHVDRASMRPFLRELPAKGAVPCDGNDVSGTVSVRAFFFFFLFCFALRLSFADLVVDVVVGENL
jgi:hypothetical protein